MEGQGTELLPTQQLLIFNKLRQKERIKEDTFSGLKYRHGKRILGTW